MMGRDSSCKAVSAARVVEAIGNGGGSTRAKARARTRARTRTRTSVFGEVGEDNYNVDGG
jgi:hypothetical protein